MKLFIILTVAISSFLNADYLMHPKTDALVKELVDIHGFEKKYVEEVLSNAEFVINFYHLNNPENYI